jgi:hypothetical protein
MARNNNKMTKRRSAKIEPAVTTLRFPVTNVTGQSTSFIDLSQCASLISRRFYRQGLNWAVRSIKILEIQVTVHKDLLRFQNYQLRGLCQEVG